MSRICRYLPLFGIESVDFTKYLLDLAEIVERSAPVLDRHLFRTAFICAHLGEILGLEEARIRHLVMSAVIHDVGLTFVSRIRDIRDLAGLDRGVLISHGELSRWVIQEMSFYHGYLDIAEITRHHHVAYSEEAVKRVPFESFVVAGADILEVNLRRYQQPWLYRDEVLASVLRAPVHPAVAEAIEKLVKDYPLAFWYDLVVSKRAAKEYLENVLGVIPIKTTRENLLRMASALGRIVDFRSPVTSTHSARVSAVAKAIGELFGLSFIKLLILEVGGLLHDIGKLVVPIDILEKPARLVPEEYALIQTHVYYTYRFLRHLGMPDQLVEAASFHHERLDGSGYPFGIGGECMFTSSRIMQIADVFAALSEKRPYKSRWGKDTVLSVLKQEVEAGRLCPVVFDVVRANFDHLYQVAEEAAERARMGFEEFLAKVGVGKEEITDLVDYYGED